MDSEIRSVPKTETKKSKYTEECGDEARTYPHMEDIKRIRYAMERVEKSLSLLEETLSAANGPRYVVDDLQYLEMRVEMVSQSTREFKRKLQDSQISRSCMRR
jgi:hypothetical protein